MGAASGFGAFLGGFAKKLGSNALEVDDRRHAEEQQAKRDRINLLQHALDSGNLDESSQQTAMNDLLSLVDPSGGKGKKGEESKALLNSIIMPFKLLHGLSGAGQRPRNPESRIAAPPTAVLPDAPARGDIDPAVAETYSGMDSSAALPAAPVRSPAPAAAQSAGGAPSLPSSPSRYRLLSREDKLNQADEEQKRKLQVSADFARGEREKLSADQEKEVARRVGLNEKFLGRKLKEEETRAVVNAVLGQPQDRAPRAPQKLAIATANQIPVGATNLSGQPIDRTKPNARYQEILQDGEIFYEPVEDRKLSATEQRMADEIAEVQATTPGIPEEAAKRTVLVNRAKKRAAQLTGLLESNEGKAIANQVKQELASGQLSATSARGLLSTSLNMAKVYNMDPSSDYFLSGVEQIQAALLAEAGIDATELIKLAATAPGAGGKTKPATETPGGTSADDPLGILSPKK